MIFRLSKHILFRVRLVRLRHAKGHRKMVSIHHIIIDIRNKSHFHSECSL